MRKCTNISPYVRRPLVIYDFASDPFWISLYMRKILFLFYQCTRIFSTTAFSDAWVHLVWLFQSIYFRFWNEVKAGIPFFTMSRSSVRIEQPVQKVMVMHRGKFTNRVSQRTFLAVSITLTSCMFSDVWVMPTRDDFTLFDCFYDPVY